MNFNALPSPEAAVTEMTELASPQEVSFLGTKADELLRAAADHQKFGDITLDYKAGSGMATWKFGIETAAVSYDRYAKVTTFSFGKEFAEETGSRKEMTHIAFRNGGAWSSQTVVREKESRIKRSPAITLDRATYDSALKTMVALESRQFVREKPSADRSFGRRVVAYLLNSATN